MKEIGIPNRGPKKRDPTCIKLLHAITIPAGTILRQHPGKEGTFDCPVAFGKFVIEGTAADAHVETYRKVVA